MTISDIFLIIAVLIAPFIAVFGQKQIETWKSKRDVKLWIFKTLMATRGATVSPTHVQALNMIDLEFSDKNKNEKAVKEIWKEYLDHLASLPKDPEQLKDALPAWTDKNSEYLSSLLQVMGRCFGYDFDKVHIKRGIYSPEAHAVDEIERKLLRFYALQVLAGKKSISTLTSLTPSDKNAADFGQKFQKAISDFIDGEREFKVTVKKDRAEHPDEH